MARNLFLMVTVILMTLIMLGLPASEAIAGKGGNGNGNGNGNGGPGWTTGWYAMYAPIELVTRRRDISGRVTYRERTFKGDTEKRLRVHMRNGPALSFQRVRFNGEKIGIFMTDFFGEGHFFMGTHRTTGQWNTMPADFPTVVTGDAVSAGRASGTFEPHPSTK